MRQLPACEQYRAAAAAQQLVDNPGALLGSLAGSVDRLHHALAERAVMVHLRVTELGERKTAQARHGFVR